MDNNPTTTLTLAPIGGLANRMRAVLSANALARHVGSRLRVVWLKEKGLYASFSALFEPLPIAAVEELSPLQSALHALPRKKNLYAPRLYQAWKYDLCLFDRQLEVLLADPDHLAALVRGKNVFISSGLGFFPSDDSLFGKVFVPVRSILDEVERRCAAMGTEVVGVHVRRTDNVVSIAESPVEAFVRRMESFPQAVFYLATDSEEVKAYMRQRFPHRVFTSPFQADRTSLKGMREAVVEMYTLARSSHFLGSYYSSFSDIVIEMNGHGETMRKSELEIDELNLLSADGDDGEEER